MRENLPAHQKQFVFGRYANELHGCRQAKAAHLALEFTHFVQSVFYRKLSKGCRTFLSFLGRE
jgi:hypothetical protein